ncbi:helix-turn-helix domain-containing protein [Cytobacillus sp. IB215665]|uniref:helix-turn-helix domain-containing protein n=1 Tax=Cytobacillus sp. IB215665 TaxID=3097357 RepID=UPI002A10589C|nr:helix-turn-helix domain-containing protein [Cytobacillus sp. IB215665]MDX8365242.1 helix-turn-helix domain-containing protein [Cytobacillus sp. IB215665]
MINNEELGAIVKKIRKERNITQKELAKGLCCQTTISYLEKGKAFPRIDTMYYIASRLGVTVDYFFQLIEEEQNIYASDTVTLLEKLVKEKDYQQIFELASTERINLKFNFFSQKYIQYINWQYWRSAQYLGKVSWEECVKELNNLINHQTKEIPLFQDLRIKNVIANVLAENRQEKEAKNIYLKLLAYDLDLYDYQKLKVKVFYNLATLYIESKEYDLAQDTANKGIHYSKKIEDMCILGNLFFQVALCSFQLNKNKDQTNYYFEQAKFFYKFFGHSMNVEYIDM